jgi:hypothetical protein
MSNPRSTAERMRPILQAMERSIESARRRRLHEPAIAPVARPQPAPEPKERIAVQSPRQKARPKRAAFPGRPNTSGDYRAEAV